MKIANIVEFSKSRNPFRQADTRSGVLEDSFGREGVSLCGFGVSPQPRR
jgi:hypothetical protein